MNKYTTTKKHSGTNIEEVGCTVLARNIKEAIACIESMRFIVISSSEDYKCLTYKQ